MVPAETSSYSETEIIKENKKKKKEKKSRAVTFSEVNSINVILFKTNEKSKIFQLF